MELVQGLAIAAIVNGLRKSGFISDAAVAAIAEELRSSAETTDAWGHTQQSEVLRKLADDISVGAGGE